MPVEECAPPDAPPTRRRLSSSRFAFLGAAATGQAREAARPRSAPTSTPARPKEAGRRASGATPAAGGDVPAPAADQLAHEEAGAAASTPVPSSVNDEAATPLRCKTVSRGRSSRHFKTPPTGGGERAKEQRSSRTPSERQSGKSLRRRSSRHLDAGVATAKDKLSNTWSPMKKAISESGLGSFKRLPGLGARKSAFEGAMREDNEKRGAAAAVMDDQMQTVEKVAASDAGVPLLDLSHNVPFTWRSQPQKRDVLERIASGSALKVLRLNGLGLDNSHALPLAAIAGAHAGLEQLTLDANALGEAAMLPLARACHGHPSLVALSVAHQKTGMLSQPSVLALIAMMEATPGMTRLHLGEIKDNTLRHRFEAASMRNLEHARERRVQEGAKDTRKAAEKKYDWYAEAERVATSQAHQYGASDGRALVQSAYVLRGNGLWQRATRAERAALLDAFCMNTTVHTLDLFNACIDDKLCVTLGRVLKANSSLTSLNLSTNIITSAGVEEIAAGLLVNESLHHVDMSNLHAPGSSLEVKLSQRAEEALAHAVNSHFSLTKLYTVKLRHVPARDLLTRAVERNAAAARERLRRESEAAQVPECRRGLTL